MWLDRVSNPRPLTYESGALLTALCGPAFFSSTFATKARINYTIQKGPGFILGHSVQSKVSVPNKVG